MRMYNIAVAMIFMILTTSFSPAKATEPTNLHGTLLINGSSAMGPMVEAMANLFMVSHPDVKVTVEITSSASGIANTQSGKSDIGMSARDLTDSESELFSIPIARDGVVFAVNNSNPVVNLTKAELVGILTGKVTNWKMVAGTNSTIEVGPISEGHASRQIVSQCLGINTSQIAASRTLNSTLEVLQFISENQNAIAFVSTGGLEKFERDGKPVKPVKLDGILPGSGSIRDGTWPLSRPFNLLTRRVPSGVTKAFIEFTLSPAVHDIVTGFDFTPYQ